ncbi:SPOSA6832_02770, partial [Sporobolomyces salmonicolor]
MQLHPVSLLVALLMALRGLRSSSLSHSGALTAFLLGYLTLANSLRVFGVCLLGFYLAGSKATRVKAAIKATYEAPENDGAPLSPPGKPALGEASTVAHGGGGRRTATQVLCNALVGSSCAFAWRVLYSGEFSAASGWEDERWCVVGRFGEGDARKSSRALVLAAVGFWAACCGDTALRKRSLSFSFSFPLAIASPPFIPPLTPSPTIQLGILSRSSPLLITRPFSGPVPRGTNGGVSGWGTLVSLFGGVLVGVLAVTCLIIQGQGETCGAAGLGEVVGVAAVAGLGGSLLDSFLGALLQPSYYSSTRSLIVHSPSPSPKQPGEKIIRVKGSGWDVLSNNGVNAVMGVTAAGVVGWWAML